MVAEVPLAGLSFWSLVLLFGPEPSRVLPALCSMKIKAVAYRVPRHRVDNDGMVERINRSNPHLDAATKAAYLKAVHRLLVQSGAEYRHLRDVDSGERAVDPILEAMDEALLKAGMSAADIDLLIYCGVGRGFLEPANAYFYARAKGMADTQCFDVVDACMSWVRAIHIAQHLLAAGVHRSVMVVNGEFNSVAHANWEIRGLRSLPYVFPMYTIGEAATATILTGEGAPWRFDFASRPESAPLCTIAMQDYASYIEPDDRFNLNGTNRFVSFGRELFGECTACLTELFTRSVPDVGVHTLYLPHTASRAAYEEIWAQLGNPPEALFTSVYPRFGNVVSASIPVGLCLAQEEGRLREGDSIAMIPASAGIVAAVVQFTF